MLDQYWAYTFADPVFYDSPARLADGEDQFAAARGPAPAGWRRNTRDVWATMDPDGVPLPDQGWKVHVSSTVDDAERALDTVWDFCVEHKVAFKFLPTVRLLRIFNGKYMPRESSGKFVAIYPADTTELRAVLDGLGPLLDGVQGARVLSDLRWNDGPLHVRYGGFTRRLRTSAAGDRVPAIADPDGVLVPDRRAPVFHTPPWVSVPDFVAAQIPASVSEFPYWVDGALHFSNAGGVYLATRRSDGAEVVLKEARPHAGLDRDGRDAVTRLRHEYEVLRLLDGIDGVPRAHELLTAGGHSFLVMDRVPGEVIWTWVARNHPLVTADPTDADFAAYTANSLALGDRLAALLDRVHERGVVYGDLHPGNIMVTPEGGVALVDFEVAGKVGESDYRPALGASGFRSARLGRQGADLDRSALAAVRLWLFQAQDRIWELDPAKVTSTLAEVERRFPIPASVSATLRADLAPSPVTPPGSVGALASGGRPPEVDLAAAVPDLAAACQSIADAIAAAATPDRDDRLYPGDIAAFGSAGADFAHGAAGVLWARSVTGVGHDPDHLAWLLRAIDRPSRLRPGFFTGSHGIAHVLAHFGELDAALGLLDVAAPMVSEVRAPNLYQGLAGIGLNLIHFARLTGQARFGDEAERIGGRLVDGDTIDPVTRAGLCHGWSGPALFLLRLHELTGESRWLDAAVDLVHRDLDTCVVRPDGTMLAGERTGRALPYLASGTAGVGLVLDEVLRQREDERLRAALPAVLAVFRPESVAESNLLEGRAGLLATAARLSRWHPDDALEAAITRHVRNFAWDALSYQGHLVFPGRRQFRLSMDLATGSAGVLLAFAAVRDRKLAFLPFLGEAT